MRWLDGISNSMDTNLSKQTKTKTVEDRGGRCAVVHGVTVRHDLVTEEPPPLFSFFFFHMNFIFKNTYLLN